VLIVDDVREDAELMLASLKRAGYSLSFDIVFTAEIFRDRLERVDYDVIISDHNLRTWTGRDALEILQKTAKDVPFIVVTGSLGDEAAVDYIKRGAADYVLKNRLDLLPTAVSTALREKTQREEKQRLNQCILTAKREWEITFDTVPDAVLILDSECRIQRANQATTEMLGLPFSRVIGRRCYEVLHGTCEAPISCPHQQLLITGAAQRSDYQEIKLGKTFDVTTTPLRANNGTLQGCIHVLRDITDRNRAELALRDHEEKLRLLLYSTAEAIYALNLEGQCTFSNPACLRLLGYSDQQEILGRNMHALAHHTRSDDVPFQIEQCPIYLGLKSGERAHLTEDIFWRADGTSFPVEYWSYPIWISLCLYCSLDCVWWQARIWGRRSFYAVNISRPDSPFQQ